MQDRLPQDYLLACDPGSNNFGYALYWLGEPGKWELVECGMLPDTAKSMGEDFAPQAHAFRDAIAAVLTRNGIQYTEDPDTSDRVLCVAERFVSRGMRSSTISENVSVMLGILSVLSDYMDVILASEWKHYVNKHAGTFGFALVGDAADRKERAAAAGKHCLYRAWKERSGGPRKGFKSHVIDAVLIGQHWLTTWHSVPRLVSEEDFEDVYADMLQTYMQPERKAKSKTAKPKPKPKAKPASSKAKGAAR